ncbi:MAG: mechanosensitive ion channel family protein [Gammaproteobacteria bacterium]|nr:mechanosensitive ion channel family protein [Gammaproteobacteria bacterium]
MQDFLIQIERWAALLGPNKFIQATAIAVAFIVAGKIADFLLSNTLAKIANRSSNRLDDQLIGMLHRPIFLSFVLIGLGLATQRIDMAESAEYLTLGLLKTIAIIVWYSLFRRLASIILSVLSRGSGHKILQANMLPLMDNTVKVVLAALTAYFIFLAWNIDVTAWLASAGIVGLALSFAAKDTLSNLFAGVSIVADAPYKSGDYITLESGERGQVTHIGLRSTRILTRDDVEITVPNGLIGNSKIVNETGGISPRHRIRVAVGVAYGSDVDHVIATLARVADDHSEVCQSPQPRVRFRKFGDSSLDFELLCWINQPVDRGRILHELNCSVYKAFVNEAIVIPYPQRDLHVRTMPNPD